jgi:hypothetical protein
MDASHPHTGTHALAAPHDRIDVAWLEQRLKDHNATRRSKLSAYFEGVMEFVQDPPTLSRSPTPDRDTALWQEKMYTSPRPRDNRQGRWSGKTPRVPIRRTTNESDSDMSDLLQRRKRRKFSYLMGREYTDFDRTCYSCSCTQTESSHTYPETTGSENASQVASGSECTCHGDEVEESEGWTCMAGWYFENENATEEIPLKMSTISPGQFST